MTCAISLFIVSCNDLPKIKAPIKLYRADGKGKACRIVSDDAANTARAKKSVKKITRKYVDNKRTKRLDCIDFNDAAARGYFVLSGEDLANLYELIAKLEQYGKKVH